MHYFTCINALHYLHYFNCITINAWHYLHYFNCITINAFHYLHYLHWKAFALNCGPVMCLAPCAHTCFLQHEVGCLLVTFWPWTNDQFLNLWTLVQFYTSVTLHLALGFQPPPGNQWGLRLLDFGHSFGDQTWALWALDKNSLQICFNSSIAFVLSHSCMLALLCEVFGHCWTKKWPKKSR